MKILNTITTLASFGFFLFSCSGDDDTASNDTQKPIIEMNMSDAAPLSCSTYQRGDIIQFKAQFTDNVALGAYSINIHNNFDQHSHDTETGNCEMDPIKTPTHPWTEIIQGEIPVNESDYVATMPIQIPSDIETGDYHFMIQLTDAQGWSTLRGISIKIEE